VSDLEVLADERELDDEQRAAVEAVEPTIAVLAGPGSGKTRTLSHRARHLLREDRVAKALLLTFTNKAAAEMKARAIDVASVSSDRIAAGTFHGFGARVLRAHGELIGIPRDFEILDQDEARDFAEGVAAAAGVANHFRAWQNHRIRRLIPGSGIAAFGQVYQDAKKADEVVDFDDLVVLVADLFQARPEIARAYGGRYRHLLVDEFQDTNAAQFQIIEALHPHVKTVSVFADDDQAIFRFVGADSANVRRFVDELGATEFPLTHNYRSREAIVAAANSLIAADPAASGRVMTASRPDGEIELRTYQTFEQEADQLAQEIADLLRGGMRASSIAVLVRSGFRGEELVRALARHQIERAERRIFVTVMSALRGRMNGRRARRLAELLGVDEPATDDTHEFLASVQDRAGAEGLLKLREMAFQGARASELAAQAQDTIMSIDAHLAIRMEPLVQAVGAFERFDSDFTVDDLLAELALGSGGRAPTEGGGVRVASLHKTKGLQWPVVYLLGLEDGHLPDYRSDEDEIPEERRACFVGVCRAEDRLVVTFVQRFRTHRKRRSRFLDEMGL
jgi:DNA helicase II / ATP-dependent DNA helicase PcrA